MLSVFPPVKMMFTVGFMDIITKKVPFYLVCKRFIYEWMWDFFNGIFGDDYLISLLNNLMWKIILLLTQFGLSQT